MLNQYLEPMTEIVMEEKGTLDKYIGDAVMAIYNAPLDVLDHAERAVVSAMRMLEALAVLNQDFERVGGVRLNIGIGIHTGEAVVGNMGSNRRFDYTAIGDTVNLASRLEGQTKFYGVNIIISESTFSRLGAQFLCRKLDRLRVVGKTQPVEIYQLFSGYTGTATQDLVNQFHKALGRYFASQFSLALQGFLEILADHPDDKPTHIFVERCQHYLQELPPSDWKGVFIAKEK
jgi:adenylate cyclase